VGSRGAAYCCAWRAGHAAVGRPDKGRGALGSATVPCFKGRGALGSVWRERDEQCSFFFKKNLFSSYFICGDPKMGYNRCPLFIMLTEQHGFCAVSFIKINKTELPKLILIDLNFVFTAIPLRPETMIKT